MNTLHHNQTQLNTQIPYSSTLRGQPISAQEWADTVAALMKIGGGYYWKSSRVVAGSCPFCGSSDTGTSEHGTKVCYKCGKVWR